MKHRKEQYLHNIKNPTNGQFANADLYSLEDCTETFSQSMMHRLRKIFFEGESGWDDPDWSIDEIKMRIEKKLNEAKTDDDFIDIANLAMFAWNKN